MSGAGLRIFRATHEALLLWVDAGNRGIIHPIGRVAVHCRTTSRYDETPYEQQLPFQQLNCDAEKLAEEYLSDNPQFNFTRVPILPTIQSSLTWCLEESLMTSRKD